ncbi:DUF3857 domain-containing protein [uncultured Flavobacterium sp.]|uniref:DUF3857 domain-containing protein n=1 Tax=uncultured Flavobacterium sp. TaxID=165435 RepID=UPI0030CA4BFD
MKKLLILTFLVSFNIFSQKYELGEVTIEELSQTNHALDSSAVAAILFKKGKVSFEFNQQEGFYIITNIKVKIKIYEKEGYDWGNFEIPLYNETNAKQTLYIKSANTYNLEGKKIEKSKLRSDGEFEEKTNQFWSKKKIAMPNVKEGSIIELEYVIKDIGKGTIDEWEFQTSIPIDYVEYETSIPQYYEYNTHFRGYLIPKKEKENITQKIILRSKDRQEINRVSNANFNVEEINFSETKTTYSLENVSAVKNEPYVNNIRNYMSSLFHELAMTKFPNSMMQTYSTDWETITKTIYDYDDFGPELNKTNYFETEIDALLQNISSPSQKAIAILNFVKNKMNWNESNGYSCLKGVNKAYKEQSGNVADINLMLTAMLRYAGLKANPVLLSTRSNGIALYPSRSAFNYVIAGIELENKIILLDATSKNSLPGILPLRDLNWSGRLIRDTGSSINIDLLPTNISKENVIIMANIDQSGIIEGKLRDQYFDYNAYFFRENNSKLNEETYIEKLEKRYQGIQIDDYSVSNMQDLEKPIVETYSFKNSNLVEIIGEKMYISPLLFFETKENPFKLENRNFPIDFSIPFADLYKITLNIPEGYKIEFIPEKINVAMQENYGSYLFNISNTANTIQISSSFSINASIVPAEQYTMLKNFYKMMIEKQTEKIVLVKI